MNQWRLGRMSSKEQRKPLVRAVNLSLSFIKVVIISVQTVENGRR